MFAFSTVTLVAIMVGLFQSQSGTASPTPQFVPGPYGPMPVGYGAAPIGRPVPVVQQFPGQPPMVTLNVLLQLAKSLYWREEVPPAGTLRTATGARSSSTAVCF
ncbi:hypothetical protein PGT21_011645 [Puccinia graminis f. sp. tritici]|uniref:Secreted protein n=1 Tax=Puccinia graminis f. sp. tritici TaxID=56615 RepID=A0A5B0RTK5_PUCGR|nr:hypothetical protein PGT21_011645 [Puccinia graminis f. sp. tritici]KAA1128203.1 hypothetical protein PGTUg99_005644 [Puccinia graminis f. sp. tritici]